MIDDGEHSFYDAVAGGADLVSWFGQVPSFHDAEILSLSLHRRGDSFLRLHGWIMTGAIGQDGYYVLNKHAIVPSLSAGSWIYNFPASASKMLSAD